MIHHEMHPSISEMQMTDNIFEVETTALAHVACVPHESGILLTDFAAACPSPGFSVYWRRQSCQSSFSGFCE